MRSKFTSMNDTSSLIDISEGKSSLRPFVFVANIYLFVLARLVRVHLEATLLDGRKAFALTGRHFHPPRVRNLSVSPQRYSREFRELHARGKVKGARCTERTLSEKSIIVTTPEGPFVPNGIALSTYKRVISLRAIRQHPPCCSVWKMSLPSFYHYRSKFAEKKNANYSVICICKTRRSA